MKWQRSIFNPSVWVSKSPSDYFIAHHKQAGRVFGLFTAWTTTAGKIGQYETLDRAKVACEEHVKGDLVRPMSHAA
jgi:hypothetical protein